MSRHEKALLRLRKKPPPADFTWDEAVNILKQFGYSELTGAGSGRKFFNQGSQLLFLCHKPHPGSILGKKTVTSLKEHIDTHIAFEKAKSKDKK